MSVFDMGGWEEVDVGVLDDDAPLEEYLVTDPGMATHRRYRNRESGEVVISRM